DFTLSRSGKPRCVIVQQEGATAPEQHALRELKLHLDQIAGASFLIVSNEPPPSTSAIIVGPGACASSNFPDLDFKAFGQEEYIIRIKKNRLLLAGGRPRGTIYAVDRFLQDQCGVRWWTPWATNIPHRSTLIVPALNIRARPPFEHRGPDWFTAFDPLCKSRNAASREPNTVHTARV